MTTENEVAARTFQYKHGDRPLEGYTIQRAAGRGGFGEVYYALSDSGREVALKLVMTYEQIELRGISQCMNLKSPQLVTIFDVKYGTDGRPWVIMEYVAGPSLSDLINASPNGLGVAKSAFFLREIAKGLTYLHDCGIVHRDLKPGNIFYENGYVKIGDYGLSKTMSMTRHSGQTVAVGTLHYMAPEIGEGRYDRTIDIYALGALLYEMLTGEVPFSGSSPAEILMKHLTSDVNLDRIEEPFQSVIRKAMAKNPADRYQSAAEMVEAVYGSENVRTSVSQFSPASLTQIAGRVAANVGGAQAAPTAWPPPKDKWQQAADRFTRQAEEWGRRVKEAGDRFADRVGKPQVFRGADQITPVARFTMAAFAMLIAAMAGALTGGGNPALTMFFVSFAIIGSVTAVHIAWKILGRGLGAETKWVRRFALGAPAAFGAAILAFPFAVADSRDLGPTLLGCLGTMLLMEWDKRLSPDRKERLSVGHLFTAGICALILSGMAGAREPVAAIATAAGASAAVSLSSMWGRRNDDFPLPPRPAPIVTPPPPPPVGDGFNPPPVPNVPPPPPQPTVTMPLAQGPNRFAMSGMMIGAFVLWIMCFSVSSHIHGREIRNPVQIPLLIAAVIMTLNVFRMSRGGLMSSQYAPATDWSTPDGRLRGLFSLMGRGIAGIVGTVFLAISLLLTVAISVNLPGLFASGALDPNLPAQITQGMGTSHWPELMIEIGTTACVFTSVLSLVFLMMARRSGGVLHLLRTVAGVLVLLGAAVALGHSLPNMAYVTPAATPGDTMLQYYQSVQFTSVIKSALIFMVGALLLMCPPCGRGRLKFNFKVGGPTAPPAGQ